MSTADSSESIDSTRVGHTLDSRWPEDEDPSSLWRTLSRGRQLGRYVMMRRIGRGGMGEVWLAWDPELDRDVAIKLLRSHPDDDRAGARLLREARAMARLAHPNIVGIYDVGTVEGQVFIAMEFVRGQTLTQWAKAGRGWRQVVDVYLAAGRGLAAAHAADMVHRDFKPDNAMVDEQGRVRVMDFGLASARGPGPESESQREDVQASHSHADEPVTLTRTGALLGTPAYMAPEQFRLETPGPPADQFAFCIAMWEAIYEQRPFAGTTLEALAEQVQEGHRRPPPKHSKVPARVRRVLERGLASDPAQRWPSMAVLLTELGRARTGSSWLWAGAMTLTLGAATFGLWAINQPDVDQCQASELASAELWSDEARARVAEGLRRSGRPHAPETSRRVEHELDRWAASWAEVARAACEGRDDLPSELRVGQAVCLARLEQTASATLDVLANADGDVADRAIELVAGLPDPRRCADARVLASASPPPDDPEVAIEVEAIAFGLAEVVALRDAGQIDPAYGHSVELVERARASGHGPTLGEVLAVHGTVQRLRNQFVEASDSQREALRELVIAGAFESAARVAGDLVFTTGVKLRRFEEARAWSVQSEALLRHIGAGWELEVDRLGVLALLTDAEGNYDEAVIVYQRALALAEGQAEPDRLRIGHLLDHMGVSQERLGQLDEAVASQQRAIELFEAELGTEHPTVASAWLNLGNARYVQGRRDEAKAAFTRALELYAASVGPEHPANGSVLTGLGAVQLGEGDNEGARDSFLRALAVAEGRLGPDHLDLVPPLNNLGIVQARLGELEAAEASARRALGLLELANGKDHPDLLATLDTLGSLLERKGDHVGAKLTFERSLAIGEAALGAGHPELAYSLLGLASNAVANEDLRAAEAWYRRLLACTAEADGYQGMAGQAEFGLARILADRGERVEARTLASSARTRLEQVPEGDRDGIAELDALLEELG